jgi:Tol biopolymer transport system component
MNGSLTADGSLVAYGSVRSDGADIVLHDLATGHSTIIASGAVPHAAPKISPDGSHVFYQWLEAGKYKSFVVPAAGGVPQTVCDDCYQGSWAADGKRLLVGRTANRDTGFLDIATGQFQPVFAGFTTAPHLSWDNRWLTFYLVLPADTRHTQIFIVPVHDGIATPRNEWIEVTDGSAFDVIPEFSPNGNLLYFESQRDGSRCIWALRLDPVTKRASVAPFPVYHFHSARQSPINVPAGTGSNPVARDKIAYISVERTGNIWMIKLD